jgi:hypothetical protein
MHVPRVVAALAARRGLRPLLALERLSRLPTRYFTGQYIAARAVVE